MNVSTVDVTQADDTQWQEYNGLARRAYGQPVPDVTRLSAHADRRVALRGGRVIAGGMGLLVPQWFGGRAVPSASMACGCVAPEERGQHLAARLTVERLRPLREQGAVLATLWTASTGYVRRLGWEAPTTVSSVTVPTDALRRRFDESEVEVQHGETTQLTALRDTLAARWNGPWQRPAWWAAWQQAQHPDLTTYRFGPPGGAPTGVVCLDIQQHPVEGRRLVVQDFWATDHSTAVTMLTFLGRHGSRIATVTFERTSLPPGLLLQHHLRRAGVADARVWHPWMLRVLDLRRAVELRGWPDDVDLVLPLEIVSENGQDITSYTLRISNGHGELSFGGSTSDLILTRAQFAVWYAGGYRSTAAAALAGVRGDPASIARLIRATNDREPWLADYF